MNNPFKLISLFLALTILIIPLNGIIFADEDYENEEETTPQKNTEDSIWVCPMCGEFISFIETICPSCGYERQEQKPEEGKIGDLRWLCPECGEYVKLDEDYCPYCEEEKPQTDSNQFQLFYEVKKHPTMRNAGKWMTIIGICNIGGSFALISLPEKADEGIPVVLIVGIPLLLSGLVLAGIGIPLLIIGRGSDKIPINPATYDKLGYNSLDNYRLLDDRPMLQEEFQLVGMSVTF